MSAPTVDALAAVPLFQDLSPDDLAALAQKFEVEQHRAGTALVTEGRSGYAFYVLAEGRASVSEGDQQVRELGPGAHFGEMAIIGDGRRTATVRALTDVTVWVLFGTAFRVLQTTRPEVAALLAAPRA
jgi:voltage-gated potassium channel